MATKKQKRLAAKAKHDAYMEELRQSGLEALRKDRKNRAREERRAWQKQHDAKHNWKNRVKECPLCSDILRASRRTDEVPEKEPVWVLDEGQAS